MLKVLFPAAVAEITQRAAEQRNAALWSGKAAASDIAAGLALGKALAAVFVARAGLSTLSSAAAVVLSYLFPAGAPDFEAMKMVAMYYHLFPSAPDAARMQRSCALHSHPATT